jgi:hypothetical protein
MVFLLSLSFRRGLHIAIAWAAVCPDRNAFASQHHSIERTFLAWPKPKCSLIDTTIKQITQQIELLIEPQK